MLILTNCGGVAMTNAFLVADEIEKKAVFFVDAPDHTVDSLLEEAHKRGWTLEGLWFTHGHFDHFADHARVKKRFPESRILLHELDCKKAEHPEVQTRFFGLPFDIPPLTPDAHVTDNQTLRFGSLEAIVIHTPGHSPGHVAYYLPAQKLLIGGDLIIGGSVGRTDLPDSNPLDMESSIRRVMALPPDTKLLGGHGPASNLDRERQRNHYVQAALAT